MKIDYIIAIQFVCIATKGITKIEFKNFIAQSLFKQITAMILSSDKTITHLDLDCFFVAVSRLMNPTLNGKPVLIGGSSDRGVVAACSYEARKYGIHSAMPMKLAKRLCPEALIVHGDYEMYAKKSDEVTQIISEKVPVYEKSSIDEFYLDLTGMDRFFGCYKWSTELWKTVKKETGLPSSFGISANKTVSKIATDFVKPDSNKKIDRGTEKEFLAPMSVSKIPMVGEKTYQVLRQMGVEKILTLQQMPVELMKDVLGENGKTIWQKANGIDDTPVIPYNERKSISSEETFDQDTIDIVKMKSILIRMTEQLLFQLRDENKLTSCITIKIRYSNFDTHTMQSRIPYTSCDHHLIPRVKELFDKLYERRMLIRLIGVRFSHLVGGGYQINLFEDSMEQIHLYQAMDKMKKRYGDTAVLRAAGSDFTPRMFNPFNGLTKGQPLQKKIQ
ncbi:MAG: DNA polymerase IV [Chitinophagales bacterium]|nr:DNA polymerase IV [Chitinophagales bacterium]